MGRSEAVGKVCCDEAGRWRRGHLIEADREVVITANGRPFAVLARVDPERLEEEILAMRRARVRSALSRARAAARAKGRDRMTGAEIDRLISKVRRERRRSG